jgi:hypothetical protein
LAFKILLCEPTVFRDPSFGFCLGIKFAEITGRAVRPRPGHLHAPMTPRLDWLHYKIGTHQSDGTFHSLCLILWALGVSLTRDEKTPRALWEAIIANAVFGALLYLRGL